MTSTTRAASPQRARATETKDTYVVGKLREMYRAFPVAEQHRKQLRRIDCDITFVRAVRASDFENGSLRQTYRDSFLCLVRLGERLEHQFSIFKEIPLIYSPHEDLQGRYIKNLDLLFDLLPEDRSSIDRSVVLIYARNVHTQQVESISDSRTRLVLLPDLPEIGDNTGESQADNGTNIIMSRITGTLYSTDLYAQKTPVTQDQFFGRAQTLKEIRANIKNGQISGVFGLRKSGKTSILKQLDITAPDDQCYVYYDLEKCDSPKYGRPIPNLLISLADLVRDHLKKKGAWVAGVASFIDKSRAASEYATVDNFQRMMNETLKNRRNVTITLVLCLDEIEHLLPYDVDSMPLGANQDEIARFFGLLRALMQENPNFSFILAGITGYAFEKSQVYGRSNPLFQLSAPIWLSSLTLEDSSTLLRKIGARQGMTWSDEAIDLAWQESGGHPLFLRKIASMAFSSLDPARLDTARVTRQDVALHIADFQSVSASVANQILAHYFEFYREDQEILELNWDKEASQREIRETFPDSIQRVLDLGLVASEGSGFTPMPLLKMGAPGLLAQRRSLHPITAARVHELVSAGENNEVEFKESFSVPLSNPSVPEKEIQWSALRAVLGFSNAEGGTLLIGVRDNGTVVGLAPDISKYGSADTLIRRVNDLIERHVSKAFLTTNCRLDLIVDPADGNQVLAIQVLRSTEAIFLSKQLVQKSNTDSVYVRVNSQTNELKGKEILAFSR